MVHDYTVIISYKNEKASYCYRKVKNSQSNNQKSVIQYKLPIEILDYDWLMNNRVSSGPMKSFVFKSSGIAQFMAQIFSVCVIRVRYFCLTISHFPCTGSCTFVGLWKICSCLFIPILHSEPYDNLYNSSVVLLPWDYRLAAFLLYALKLDCHLHQNFSLERNIQVPG